ncbi:ROK family transcriptional regulator [Enterocloster citroniae]|uniref:ROK family transcriptional regulator n=1 Tax=Enterocloster citroniae TaxID=358743 RepID=UPI00349E5836
MNKSVKGLNNEDLLMSNRAVILQCLKRNGVCSRADLAKETGLTQATISKIMSALIELNIVHETGFITGELGRRSRGVILNAADYKVIGIKISRRSFSIGLFDIGGRDYDIYKEAIPKDQSPQISIRKIREVAEDYISRSKGIIAVGVTVPGPYLRKESKIAVMTETTGWNFLNLKKEFSDLGGVPVFIEHDANAAAIAEWWFGQFAMATGTLVYLLADEGIGAGVVVNGSMLTGANGIAAEIGHISVNVNGQRCGCGNYGCLEGYCSSLAFVKKTRELLKEHPESILSIHYQLTAEHIFDAAYAGDELACSMVEYAGRYLGYGIVTLVNAYDPSAIVIGNTMAKGGTLLMDSIREVVRERILPEIYSKLSMDFSTFKIDPVLYGAAALATDRFLKNPSSFLSIGKH